MNFYFPHIVAVREDAIFRRGDTPMGRGYAVFVRPDHLPVTTMDWIVQPDGLYDLLIRLRDDAPGVPLYITENGAAGDDYVNPDGTSRTPNGSTTCVVICGRPIAPSSRAPTCVGTSPGR